MLTKLKQKIQQTLTTQAQIAHKTGLTPNSISAIGITLALLSAAAYTQWQNSPFYLLLATTLLLLSGYCDALDGIIARLHQQTTPFGAFLDSLLDRYADAAILIAITASALCDTTWGLIALTGTLLVSYTRAKAETAQIKMETIGIAERAERILILAVATITAYFWQPATIMKPTIILLAILTNLTVLQRTLHAYRKLKKKARS